MTVHTSAGSTLKVSSTLPSSLDNNATTGFPSVTTWVMVGEVTDLGQYGKTYNTVAYTSIGQRQTKLFKGSYKNGTMSLKMGRDVNDAGQTLMKAALASDNDYAFQVTLQDGSKNYFTGKVTAFTTTVSTVDTITMCDATIELQCDVVEM